MYHIVYCKFLTTMDKTSMSIGDKKVSMTPLCFKGDRHGHYVVVCLSKGLHFCIEKPKFELESYSTKEETFNEDELSEEYDCYDGMIEGHSLIVQPLLIVSKRRRLAPY